MTYQTNLQQLFNDQLFNNQRLISQATLASNEECKVLYNSAKDIVELEVGGTTLRFAAANFFMMNEMMRKAAAKLVIQTELHHAVKLEKPTAENARLEKVRLEKSIDEKMKAEKAQICKATFFNSLQHA